MKVFILFCIISSQLFAVDARADLQITLAQAASAARGNEERDSPTPEFTVTISNPDSDTVDIAGDWQHHTLLVDGKPYQIIQTMWWCMASPKIETKANFRRDMALNYYQKLSLKAGNHEIQFRLGTRLSNKLTIRLEHNFASTAGSTH